MHVIEYLTHSPHIYAYVYLIFCLNRNRFECEIAYEMREHTKSNGIILALFIDSASLFRSDALKQCPMIFEPSNTTQIDNANICLSSIYSLDFGKVKYSRFSIHTFHLHGFQP